MDSARQQYVFAQIMKRSDPEEFAAEIHAAIRDAADEIWQSMRIWGVPDRFIPNVLAEPSGV